MRVSNTKVQKAQQNPLTPEAIPTGLTGSDAQDTVDLSKNPFLEYDIESLFQIPVRTDVSDQNTDALNFEDIQNLPSPGAGGEAAGASTPTTPAPPNVPSNESGSSQSFTIEHSEPELPTVDSVTRDVSIVSPKLPVQINTETFIQSAVDNPEGVVESSDPTETPCDSIVTTYLDGVDPLDDQMTLREAILQGNQLEEPLAIHLCDGLYQLSLSGRHEDAGLTGDLDVYGQIVIEGHSLENTIIDAASLDRVFHVMPGSELTLKNLTIQGGDSDVFSGGGIYNSGNVILENVKIVSNQARIGGAIFNSAESSMTIDHSIIEDNQSHYYGGAILNDSSHLEINYSVLQGNQTFAYGGGITNLIGSVTINQSLIFDNSADLLGGGIVNFSGDITVNTSTLSGNAAGYLGGGFANLFGWSVDMNNSTTTENSASLTGAGIYQVQPSFLQSFNLYSSIVAGNENDADVSGSSFKSLGYNLIGNADDALMIPLILDQFGSLQGTSATGHAGVLDSGLNPLADNGGATWTHALSSHSIAIDAGNPQDFGADQRDLWVHQIRDVGAFEFLGEALQQSNLLQPSLAQIDIPTLDSGALAFVAEVFQPKTVSAQAGFAEIILKLEEILVSLSEPSDVLSLNLTSSPAHLDLPQDVQDASSLTPPYQANTTVNMSDLYPILSSLPHIMQQLHGEENAVQDHNGFV